MQRNVYIYGCGIIAPEVENYASFLSLLKSSNTILKPGWGSLFQGGYPKFDWGDHKAWIEKRHSLRKYQQWVANSGEPVSYALGSTIDALKDRPDLENRLKELDRKILIVAGGSFADIETIESGGSHVQKAQNEWDLFWEDKQELYLEFTEKLISIEETPCGSDKLVWIKTKNLQKKELIKKYECPTPPWESVSPKFLWNIPNAAAAQISMLLGLHGHAYGLYGACATFGLGLHQAFHGIQSGRYDGAIVCAVDPSPTHSMMSTFYQARVLAMGKSNPPMTDLRGTHLSGGGAVWILGAQDAFGDLEHLKTQILGVGISSDAEHIITPSTHGPHACMEEAIENSSLKWKDLHFWDLHATGTPGDLSEIELIKPYISQDTWISARKGWFGHGMGVSGGWELTAQTLGLTRSSPHEICVPRTGISTIPTEIQKTYPRFLTESRIISHKGPIHCGKLSMGVGGISSCVLTRVDI